MRQAFHKVTSVEQRCPHTPSTSAEQSTCILSFTSASEFHEFHGNNNNWLYFSHLDNLFPSTSKQDMINHMENAIRGQDIGKGDSDTIDLDEDLRRPLHPEILLRAEILDRRG